MAYGKRRRKKSTSRKSYSRGKRRSYSASNRTRRTRSTRRKRSRSAGGTVRIEIVQSNERVNPLTAPLLDSKKDIPPKRARL